MKKTPNQILPLSKKNSININTEIQITKNEAK
jgi:hypothetical protein